MDNSQNQEHTQYIKELLNAKPWLSCLPLKTSRLEYLKRNFPIEHFLLTGLEGKELQEYKSEIEFVQNEVVSKRNLLREKKSEYELLLDARYFNKYTEYLHKRIQTKNLYQRLEVSKEATKAELKKAYFKLALIWHPDNIKKKYKYGFANEAVFTKLVAEIFQLFEEAYRTLGNEEARKQYDLSRGS